MKSTSDLFNEIIPLGRLIHMVNQKKDRLLNEYLSPLDITAAQFKVLCSIRCAACITPVELKKVLSVDLGALTRMLDRLVCKGWVERLPNPNDKRGVLVKLTTSGAGNMRTMPSISWPGPASRINKKPDGGRSCNT